MAKNAMRRTGWQQKGKVIDIINIVLTMLVLLAGVFLILDVRKYIIMFPVIFGLAAVMNGTLAIKKYKMDQYVVSVALFLGMLVLLGFCVFSLIVVL